MATWAESGAANREGGESDGGGMCFGDLTIQNSLGSVSATVTGSGGIFQRHVLPVCFSLTFCSGICCCCLGRLSFQNLERYILYSFLSLRTVIAILID